MNSTCSHIDSADCSSSRSTSRSLLLYRATLFLAIASGLWWADQAHAQAPDTTFWVTNGPVFAMARAGNTIYVGGAFSRVGPALGGGIPFDPQTGGPISPFPKVAGVINAAAPDGKGGWYIAGVFSSVGGRPRSNLAHVRANGSVADWN